MAKLCLAGLTNSKKVNVAGTHSFKSDIQGSIDIGLIRPRLKVLGFIPNVIGPNVSELAKLVYMLQFDLHLKSIIQVAVWTIDFERPN